MNGHLSAALWRSCAALALLLGLAACASAPTPTDTPTDPTAEAAKQLKAAPASPLPPIPVTADAEPPSAVVWSSGSQLHLGFRDGALATAEPAERRLSMKRLGDGGAPVAAISADGRMAVVAAQPVVLYDTTRGEAILHFPDVKGLYSARFAPQGDFLVVAEGSGRMHVWSRDQLRPGAKGETLTALLGRQNPAMSARFAPLSGAIAVTPRGEVVFGDRDGHVSTWSIEQQQTFRLMRLSSPPWSMAGTGRYIAAASKEGQLGVAAAGSPRFEAWSQQAHARFVAAAPDDTPSVVLLEERAVSLVDPATGVARWTVPHTAASPCGVSLSPGAQAVAVCLDNAIVLLDGKDGHPTGMLQYVKGELRWVDAAGAPVTTATAGPASAAKR